MGILRREEIIFNALSGERRSNIEIVGSAYASVLGSKAYLSMPVTSGKRFYEILDRYGVKTVAELEKKRPGALREEIILPNISEAKLLAERLAPELNASLIVPGVFETRKQRWTQDEYMVLWLRLITSYIKEIYLLDGWEYSNGGVMEFTRALYIQHRFIDNGDDVMEPIYVDRKQLGDITTGETDKLETVVENLRKRGYPMCVPRKEFGFVSGILAFDNTPMPIYNQRRQPVDITEGIHRIVAAIKDLRRRGYPTEVLCKELGRIAGIGAFCYDYLTTWQEWAYHTNGGKFNMSPIISLAKSVGAKIELNWD